MSSVPAASDVKNFILMHLMPSSDEVCKHIPVNFRTARTCVQPCLNTRDDHFHVLSFEAVMSSNYMPQLDVSANPPLSHPDVLPPPQPPSNSSSACCPIWPPPRSPGSVSYRSALAYTPDTQVSSGSATAKVPMTPMLGSKNLASWASQGASLPHWGL